MYYLLAVLFFSFIIENGISVLSHQAANRTVPVVDGTVQAGHNMRLFHQTALTYKAANTGATGNLSVPLPAFLSTENRFISCANATSVVTFTGGTAAPLTANENVGINRALLAETSNSQGIGISNGTVIVSGAGAFAPACPVPAGYTAIQTQVVPP